MQMVRAFAEFERAMLRERTRAGLEQAKKEGRMGGRRRKLSDHQVGHQTLEPPVFIFQRPKLLASLASMPPNRDFHA